MGRFGQTLGARPEGWQQTAPWWALVVGRREEKALDSSLDVPPAIGRTFQMHLQAIDGINQCFMIIGLIIVSSN